MNTFQDIYIAEFSRKKGSRDKSKRKSRGGIGTGALVGAGIGGTIAGTPMIFDKPRQYYLTELAKGSKEGNVVAKYFNKPKRIRGKLGLLVATAGGTGAILGGLAGNHISKNNDVKDVRQTWGLGQRSLSTIGHLSREVRGWKKLLG